MHMHTHMHMHMHTPCTRLPIDGLIEAREAQLEKGQGEQLRGVAALAP